MCFWLRCFFYQRHTEDKRVIKRVPTSFPVESEVALPSVLFTSFPFLFALFMHVIIHYPSSFTSDILRILEYYLLHIYRTWPYSRRLQRLCLSVSLCWLWFVPCTRIQISCYRWLTELNIFERLRLFNIFVIRWCVL